MIAVKEGLVDEGLFRRDFVHEDLFRGIYSGGFVQEKFWECRFD